jgi:photosystem II stability/assembly factor-like uncharacterized protein
MAVDHDQLEERLFQAFTAAVVSVPDEPPVEWIDLIQAQPCESDPREARVRGFRSRIVVVAASVVVVVAAASVAFALIPASPTVDTAAARLLTIPPSKATPPAPAAAPGPWGLVSYVTDSSWHVDPAGPVQDAGALACPTSTTCYVVSGISDINPADPPVPGTVLNVTENSGVSWAQYRMPAGMGLTSALSCPSGDGQHCLAGGTDNGSPALLMTPDGGAHWADTLLPASDGSPTQLSCVSLTECTGIFTTPVNPLSFGKTVNENNEIFLGGTLSGSVYSTGDGGLTWQQADLPTDDVPQSVSCTSGRCAVIAATPTQTVSGHITRGAVFSSGDEGRTWQLGALPSGFGVVWSGPSQVDCVTASTCWATGTAVAADPEFATGTALVSVVASSDDGGLTWRIHPIPADVSDPRLYSISCPTAQQCWLGGWNGSDSVTLSSTSVILSTGDGGTSWNEDSLDVGSGAFVGAISCPVVNVCVGLGGVNSGSGRVSVYSNAADPASSE